MFAQFAGGFRQFGDLENLATKAAFATGFSGDCKHEFLATARFDDLNFEIGKSPAQEQSKRTLRIFGLVRSKRRDAFTRRRPPAKGACEFLSDPASSHVRALPITWNHVIEKETFNFKELERVLIEKVEQLFWDML